MVRSFSSNPVLRFNLLASTLVGPWKIPRTLVVFYRIYHTPLRMQVESFFCHSSLPRS